MLVLPVQASIVGNSWRLVPVGFLFLRKQGLPVHFHWSPQSHWSRSSFSQPLHRCIVQHDCVATPVMNCETCSYPGSGTLCNSCYQLAGSRLSHACLLWSCCCGFVATSHTCAVCSLCSRAWSWQLHLCLLQL